MIYRTAAVLAGFIIAALALGPKSRGQGRPPPVPIPPPLVDPNAVNLRPSVDIRPLLTTMSDRVRTFGEEISAEMLRSDDGRYLRDDLSDISRSLDDLRADLSRIANDPQRIRRRFSGIALSWENLRARLSGPVLGIPSVLRAANRVDEINAQLHTAMALNYTPPGEVPEPPANAPPSRGLRRLARASADRAEALATIVRVEMIGRPKGNLLVAGAYDLARAADGFHDGLDGFLARPQSLANAFLNVTALSARFAATLNSVERTPNVQAAWESYSTAENFLHDQIRRLGSTPDIVIPPPTIVKPSPIPAILASIDEMIRMNDSFFANVQANRNRNPESQEFLVDSGRIREAAIAFRSDAARGRDLLSLARRFGDLDIAWQRLARRVYRVAKGRQSGPNIDLVKRMGVECDRVHQMLCLPGFAPSAQFLP